MRSLTSPFVILGALLKVAKGKDFVLAETILNVGEGVLAEPVGEGFGALKVADVSY